VLGGCRAVCADAIRTGEQVTSHLQTRKVLIYFCNDLVEGHWLQVYTEAAVLLADKTEQRGPVSTDLGITSDRSRESESRDGVCFAPGRMGVCRDLSCDANSGDLINSTPGPDSETRE
jgi:hypothetical protein